MAASSFWVGLPRRTRSISRAINTQHQWSAYLVLVLVLGVLPWILGAYELYTAALYLTSVIVVISLNLVFGYTGLATLASGAFMGVGAYTSAVLGIRFGLPFAVCLAVGGCAAGLAGVIIGFPALRVSGFYLVLVTLGFSTTAQLVAQHWADVTGGPQGIRVPPPTVGPLSLADPHALYYLLLAITATVFFLMRNLVEARVGRALVAIRDSEIAAQSLGVNVAHYKVLAFGVSSFFAGVAGGCFAVVVGYLDPSSFGLTTSLQHVLYLVVGGPGSLLGPVIGTALIPLTESLRGLDKYREVVVAGLLLVFLLFAPAGIAGQIGRMWDRIQRDDALVTGRETRPGRHSQDA